jgi:hypothetical protein
MGDLGLISAGGNPASPPYRNGPYTWDQSVSFSAGIGSANTNGQIRYVDGTNGNDSNSGKSWGKAFSTIQAAVTSAGANGVVYVAPKEITDTTGDPASYAETIIIPATHVGLSLVGISRGRTQGGLPQVKKGSGSTALLTIRAPGCLIANMGFNGYGSTGGGILLDDDYSTKASFGTSIIGCHFKNCVVTTKHAESGGAIYTTAAGNAWQVLISGNNFYKNEADVVLVGTSNTRPQNWVIENNVFSGPAASVDCNLYLAGGSGINGVVINNNIFPCDPAIGSGTNTVTADLTGCVGIFSNNYHGHTGLTLGDGTVTGAVIPETVFMVNNYQENAIITRTS